MAKSVLAIDICSDLTVLNLEREAKVPKDFSHVSIALHKTYSLVVP